MYKKTFGDHMFNLVLAVMMVGLVVVTFYPVYYIVIASVSSSAAVIANPGTLIWPVDFNFGAYAKAFDHPLILSGFKNSILIIALSLPINMLLTLFCGYFMAAKNVFFKKPIIIYMLFTMFFSGGLIPTYLNQRSLGLVDTLWALIIPSALSLFNAIICKTAIENIPESLTESANIDGANDFVILFRIVTPVIMPTIAVLLLFYGVSHWNGWFSATLYISKNELLPIQNILRAVLIANNKILEQASSNAEEVNDYAETIKYAAIVITTLPILFIYPFLQRYFVKGVMIGAVKG